MNLVPCSVWPGPGTASPVHIVRNERQTTKYMELELARCEPGNFSLGCSFQKFASLFEAWSLAVHVIKRLYVVETEFFQL